MDTCVFCQIISGTSPKTLVFENDKAIVIEDIHSRAPIHLLVIPKVHAVDIMALSDEQIQDVMNVVRLVIRQQNIVNFRLVHNGGGAQMIDHFHMHIMGAVDKQREI